MPFCTNCGAEIQDGSNFCRQCGVQVSANQSSSAIPQSKAATNPARIRWRKRTCVSAGILTIVWLTYWTFRFGENWLAATVGYCLVGALMGAIAWAGAEILTAKKYRSNIDAATGALMGFAFTVFPVTLFGEEGLGIPAGEYFVAFAGVWAYILFTRPN